MIKSLLPLAIASLFASGHCADVYLDCAFGKDDLRETSILYANKKEGVFAYKMASAVAPGAKGERSHAIAVPGGGTRHLIKGLNPPMNYSGILPLAILGDDTFVFHTEDDTVLSDGRWSEYRLNTWAVRFGGDRIDSMQLYLLRQLQRMGPRESPILVELRFRPDGSLASERTMAVEKETRGIPAVPLAGFPHERASVRDGNLCLDGKAVLEGAPNNLKPFTGYAQPHVDAEGQRIVFLDFSSEASILLRQRIDIKMLAVATGDVRVLHRASKDLRQPKVSPKGTHVLFIQDGWLHVMEVESGSITRIDKAEVADWVWLQ